MLSLARWHPEDLGQEGPLSSSSSEAACMEDVVSTGTIICHAYDIPLSEYI